MTDEQTAAAIVADPMNAVSETAMEAAIVRALQAARTPPPGHIIDDAGVVRKPCFFCTDCDAVRCEADVLGKLRHIAEQSGKRHWWNVCSTITELSLVAMRELRRNINEAAEAAKEATK